MGLRLALTIKTIYARTVAQNYYVSSRSKHMELDAERLHLMQNPTKAKAAEMYWDGIYLWFKQHGISDETSEIADRWNIQP